MRQRRAATRRRPRRRRTASRASSGLQSWCARGWCPFIGTCVGAAPSLPWRRPLMRTRSAIARRAARARLPRTKGWPRDERCATIVVIVVVYAAACAVLYVPQSATRVSTSCVRTTAASTCANGLPRVTRYPARFTTRTRSVNAQCLLVTLRTMYAFELVTLGSSPCVKYFPRESSGNDSFYRSVKRVSLWYVVVWIAFFTFLRMQICKEF